MRHAILAVLALALGIAPAAGEQRARAAPHKGASHEHVETAPLSEPQRARLAQAVAGLNVAPLKGLKFPVQVGSEVPRTLRLRPLPPAAVQAAPQYRAYHFVLVDDTIVIVQPRTYRVVAVLAQGKGGKLATPKLNLTQHQRSTVRAEVGKQVSKQRPAPERGTTGMAPTAEVVIGERVPETMTIERFPDNVYRQVPALRSYQYILRENEIYVVDPRELRVIEQVE